MKRKTPSRCAGAFFIATFAGPEGKARCPRQSQHSLRQENIPAAVRGRFCAATFAGPGGKGRCLRRSRRSQGQKRRPRSDAGAFCVTTFAGQNGKGRCPQRSGALAGGKTSPQQPYRSLRQKKRPHSSRTALSQTEKTSPQQSYRSLRQKKHPTARGNASSARPALMGGANTARRARSHLWRGACAAASAAISPPAPTRGAGRFSASRASMHRPPKTQMASRR